MRKAKETQTFDFRPLGLAIREARERAGLSRNDLVYGYADAVPCYRFDFTLVLVKLFLQIVDS